MTDAELDQEALELLAHLNAAPFAHEYRMEGETFGQIVDVLRRLIDDRAEWVEVERLPIGKLFGWYEPTWRKVAKWANREWHEYTGPDHVKARMLLRQQWLDAGGSMDGEKVPPTPPAQTPPQE